MDLMIDLETLSSRSDAAIVAIGAYAFDPLRGAPEDEIDHARAFHVVVDFDSAMEHGHVSGLTLRWWFAQSDQARHALTLSINDGDPLQLPHALAALERFVAKHLHSYSRVWSHATFDMPILQYAYARTDANHGVAPWPFRLCRDLRTLIYDLDYDVREQVPFLGEKHHPLWDAFNQSRQVQFVKGQ